MNEILVQLSLVVVGLIISATVLTAVFFFSDKCKPSKLSEDKYV